MYSSIISDIRRAFHSNMISKIVTVNVGVFVLIGLVWLGGSISHSTQLNFVYLDIMNHLSVSENFLTNLKRPWTYLSYMFVHRDVFHLLWNMVMLVWFGRIIGDFLGDKRILPIYLLGGISGAVFMMLAANVTGVAQLQNVLMVGASASVMAFAMAAATLSPDYSLRLLFIGDVKLKYIVLVLILLDLSRIVNAENLGGYLSHIGGVIFGWIYIVMLRKGTDLTQPLQTLFEKIQKPLNSFEAPNRSTVKKRVIQGQESKSFSFLQNPTSQTKEIDFEERLDSILEKIKQKGYHNLEHEEKEFLNEASNKHNKS